MPAIDIRIASIEEAKAFGSTAKTDLKECPLQGTELEIRRNRDMANEVDLDLFRGGTPYLLYEDGKPVSLHIIRLSSRKRRDAWGRYCNFYLAYTLPAHRYRGYATQLCRYVENDLKSQGYDRMKSLIGSWGGFRLHLGLGHILWGKADNGCIVVDTPLHSGAFPRTTPRLIRSYNLPENWTRDRLSDILTDPKGFFAREPSEVQEAFSKHSPILGIIRDSTLMSL